MKENLFESHLAQDSLVTYCIKSAKSAYVSSSLAMLLPNTIVLDEFFHIFIATNWPYPPPLVNKNYYLKEIVS